MVKSQKTYRFAVHYLTRDPERERLVTKYFRTAAEVAAHLGCTRGTIFNVLLGKGTRLLRDYEIERVNIRTEQTVAVPSCEITEF